MKNKNSLSFVSILNSKFYKETPLLLFTDPILEDTIEVRFYIKSKLHLNNYHLLSLPYKPISRDI